MNKCLFFSMGKPLNKDSKIIESVKLKFATKQIWLQSLQCICSLRTIFQYEIYKTVLTSEAECVCVGMSMLVCLKLLMCILHGIWSLINFYDHCFWIITCSFLPSFQFSIAVLNKWDANVSHKNWKRTTWVLLILSLEHWRHILCPVTIIRCYFFFLQLL